MPRIRALRDVTLEISRRTARCCPPRIYRRCRHVVTENARVEARRRGARERDLDAFGGLMRASHASMRDDYEISCAELDLMVDAAWTPTARSAPA